MPQHTFKNLDPSYWTIISDKLTTLNVTASDLSAYVFDPVSLDSSGFSKDSYDLTFENLSPFFTVFSAPDISVPNPDNFKVSSWQTKGWGNTVEEIQQNFDFFVLNNIGGSDTRFNPENLPISTVLVNGTIQGASYFLPIVRACTDGTDYALEQIDAGGFVGTQFTVTEDGGSFSTTRFTRTFDGGTF